MESRYRVNVYVAHIGTRTIDPETGEQGWSKVGHVWIGLEDRKTGMIECYGLHPKTPGEWKDGGRLKTTDNSEYQLAVNAGKNIDTYRFDLSNEEFTKLRSFCQNQRVDHPPYVGASSDCVHWAFSAINQVGIGDGLPYGLLPAWNTGFHNINIGLNSTEKWWSENHPIPWEDQLSYEINENRSLNAGLVSKRIAEQSTGLYGENSLVGQATTRQQPSTLAAQFPEPPELPRGQARQDMASLIAEQMKLNAEINAQVDALRVQPEQQRGLGHA